jgi:hypothetical protein
MKRVEMSNTLVPKLKVAGSNPVSRSNKIKDLANWVKSFFVAFLVLHPFLHPFGGKNSQKKWARS